METVQLRNDSQRASLMRYDTTVVLKRFFGKTCAGMAKREISPPWYCERTESRKAS